MDEIIFSINISNYIGSDKAIAIKNGIRRYIDT